MSKQRRKRPDRIGTLIAPLPRFAAGMAVLPPFLLLNRLDLKALMVFGFAVLTLLAGKRIRWMYFAVLSISICFFHLLTPWGAILAQLGRFIITAGALHNGLARVLTLTGMIFLSLAAVHRQLTLPGVFGGLLGRTFYYFETLIDGKAGLSWKNLIPEIDTLLMNRFNPQNLEGNPAEDQEESKDKSARHKGWFWGVLFAALIWAVWGWTIYQSRNPSSSI